MDRNGSVKGSTPACKEAGLFGNWKGPHAARNRTELGTIKLLEGLDRSRFINGKCFAIHRGESLRFRHAEFELQVPILGFGINKKTTLQTVEE